MENTNPAVISPAVIAVVEKTPYWAVELRSELADRLVAKRTRPTSGVTIVSGFSLADVQGRWTAAYPRIVVIDANIGGAKLLQWLQKLGQIRWPARIHLVGDVATSDLEWVFRECGVARFYPKTPQPEALLAGILAELTPQAG